jgi:hypothetical protein
MSNYLRIYNSTLHKHALILLRMIQGSPSDDKKLVTLYLMYLNRRAKRNRTDLIL